MHKIAVMFVCFKLLLPCPQIGNNAWEWSYGKHDEQEFTELNIVWVGTISEGIFWIAIIRWEFSGWEFSRGGVILGENVLGGNCPSGSYHGWKLSGWELSWVRIFFGGDFPGGNFSSTVLFTYSPLHVYFILPNDLVLN